MKILFINISDIKGGSAIVAYRLGKTLESQFNTNNLFLVRSKYSNNKNVIQTRKNYFEEKIEWACNIFFNIIGLQYKFLPFSPKRIIKTANEFKPDVISLHNPIGGYFRIDDLIQLTKIAPVVWTLHDMWAFTGNASHTFGNQNWKELKVGPKEWKIYPWIFLRTGKWLLKEKKKIYQKSNFCVVVPSRWMLEQAKQSPVFSDKNITLIHHGLNLDQFHRCEKNIARKELGINANSKVIMFSAEKLKGNIFKAGNDLIDILSNLNDKLSERIKLIVVGGDIQQINKFANIQIIYTGYLKDEKKIIQCYSASDVFIYPTKADSFGLVLLESIACGTPCVTFNIGGCRDIILDGVSGYTVEPFNIEEFVNKVLKLLNDDNHRHNLSKLSRKFAEENFSIQNMASKYCQVFIKNSISTT